MSVISISKLRNSYHEDTFVCILVFHRRPTSRYLCDTFSVRNPLSFDKVTLIGTQWTQRMMYLFTTNKRKWIQVSTFRRHLLFHILKCCITKCCPDTVYRLQSRRLTQRYMTRLFVLLPNGVTKTKFVNLGHVRYLCVKISKYDLLTLLGCDTYRNSAINVEHFRRTRQLSLVNPRHICGPWARPLGKFIKAANIVCRIRHERALN
mgnify:FL=1